MTYIKKGLNIPDDDSFRQVFFYEPSSKSTVIPYKIIELKTKAILSELDLNLVKILYKFSMATIGQICNLSQVSDPILVRNRLDVLVKYRVVNKFIISDSKDTFKDDAEVLYCMDFGGLPLIEHFTNDPNVLSWNIDKVIYPAMKVNKKLMIVDFYLRIRSNPNVSYYSIEPMLCKTKTRCIPGLTFGIKSGGKERDFIVESIRSEEILYSSASIIAKINRIAGVIEDGNWKYLFRGEKIPMIFIFTDSEETALEIANICKAAGIEEYRIITTESIKKKNLAKSFFKPVVLEDKSIMLKNVDIKAFEENI